MVSNFWLYIYSGYCSAMSCISHPKQPLGWGSPFHRLHMNSLRYSCYLLTINQVLADHRPSVDQLLTDTSVKYRRTIGKVTHLELSTMSQPSVVRLSFKSWPTADWLYRLLYRLSLDWLLTDYWPSVDRLSTECQLLYRPLYRPIDQWTLPTVNMIPSVQVFKTLNDWESYIFSKLHK